MLHGVHCKKKSTAAENLPQLSCMLRLARIMEWRYLSDRIIDRNINDWRQCLEKVIEKQRDPHPEQ